jgi:HEAT repeat protein
MMKHARFVLAVFCAAAVRAPARPAAAADEKQVAKLLKQLKDRKEDKRIEASYELVDMKVEAAVPALIEALHDTSREVRYNAAGALWNLGEAARPRSRS